MNINKSLIRIQISVILPINQNSVLNLKVNVRNGQKFATQMEDILDLCGGDHGGTRGHVNRQSNPLLHR